MSDAIARLWRRIQQTVGRARVATVDDRPPAQKLQITGGAPGEVIDGVRRLAEYGFTSVPPAGSDVIVLFPAGERSNGVIIATSNQTYRLRGLSNGDVALYDDKGHSIVLNASGIQIAGGDDNVTIGTNGGIVINSTGQVFIASSSDITLDAPTIHMNGVVTTNGHAADETHIHTGGTIAGKTGPVTP
jgi:phage baseplate assembly protein V